MTKRLFHMVAGIILLASVFCPPANAQSSPLTATLEDFIGTQTRGLPGKVSYAIAPTDPRAQLAPCQFFQPFLPPGTKLWGKTMVGVRCLGPANWTIYVQVNISVTGNFLTSTRTLPSGTVLTSDDIAVRSGDLTTFPGSILTDPTQAIGKRLRAGIMSGAPLRGDLLVTSWAILQGQTVRTVANGNGFSVSSEGKAISNALEGQVVQVRTSSGQIVSGIARTNGIVDVSH